MTRKLAGLETDLANVDMNSGYATHSQETNPRYLMQPEKILYQLHL